MLLYHMTHEVDDIQLISWIRDEVARVMTKGEHTYERTYARTNIRTYGTDPISPPQLRCPWG